MKFFAHLICLFAISCSFFSGRSNRFQNQGKVQVAFTMYNPLLYEDSIKVAYTVWFDGNVTIQEVPELIFAEDTLGNKEYSSKIIYFIYANPDKHKYVSFTNFSDTSTSIKQYANIDSVEKEGIWNFYSLAPITYDSMSMIKDTILDGSPSKLFSIVKRVNGIDVIIKAYAKCGVTSVVEFMKFFGDSIGCSIQKTETYENGELTIAHTISVICDSLSVEERLVFDTWGKRK
ncbi:MAG TPA: hypothetical protein PKE30_11485 [Niabella sp.]|nr:hypothetical protein [Niabella sp.]